MDAVTKRRKLTAVYEIDVDRRTWLVHLDEEERVHTFGRTYAKAHEAIVDAAALWFNTDASSLDVSHRLPASYQGALDDLAAARARLEADQADVQRRTLEAARMLKDGCHASERDIAKLIDLSHQRVHQLLAEA